MQLYKFIESFKNIVNNIAIQIMRILNYPPPKGSEIPMNSNT